jgi:GAF domain-containing protein
VVRDRQGWGAPLIGEESRVLADEQAALRRIATLVARGVPPEEVFAVVTEEVGGLLGGGLAGMARYDSDDTVTVVATWAAESEHGGAHPLVPGPWPLDGGDLASMISRTGRSVRIDDYEGVPGPIAAFVRDELGIGSSVGSPIVVEGCLWGALFLHAKKTDPPFPQDTESRLTAFTELVDTAIANAASRAGLARLAAEQAALRRVATLVARGAPPEEVFAAVTDEVGQLLPVSSAAMGRYDPDGMFTTVAAWSTGAAAFPVGRRWIPEGRNAMTIAFETGRPARIDSFADASGPVGVAAREAGYRSAVGTPIIVEGRLWGVMTAASSAEQPLPPDTEARLASFTELVATAIANAESRAGLARLAEEQAALRRVATLVAEGVPPAKVFSALCEEVNRLLVAQLATIVRLEADGTVTVVASVGITTPELALGTRLKPGPGWVLTTAVQTGRPARKDDYGDTSEHILGVIKDLGIRSTVGVPIVVEGPLWGVIVIGTVRERFPDDAEQRLQEFTELAATAIANAESRSELRASRARIVAAADETRRRIERDLHDGIQQRLVSLGLELRAALATVPKQLGELEGVLSRVAEGMANVFDELREISRGIHPAILSEGGLEPALTALRRRSAVPVELDLHAERRLPAPVEVAAYYVVSEALTNAAKHAHASVVNVELDTHDAILQLAIRDDGIGGADPGQGSGLVGLSDRIEALGGTLQVTSPAGSGTTLLIEVPLDGQSSPVSPEP